MLTTCADWTLCGPVHTLRAEHASWDADHAAWRTPRHGHSVTFRLDGRAAEIVHHNPDGSAARQAWVYDDSGRLLEMRSWMNDDAPTRVSYEYDAEGHVVLGYRVTPDGSRSEIERSTYDDGGRRMKVEVLPSVSPDVGQNMSYGVEGSRASFGAPGATTRTTDYDAQGLPAAVTFLDAAGRIVLCVAFTRDDAGRLLCEEAKIGGPFYLAGLRPDQEIPDDARAHLETAAAAACPDGVFYSARQTYDAAGRLVERTARFGAMSDERTTYEYDDHGHLADETSASQSRSVSDDGGSAVQPDRETWNQSRYHYQYDAHGNWTERIISSRSSLNGPFTRSQVERRVITYYGR